MEPRSQLLPRQVRLFLLALPAAWLSCTPPDGADLENAERERPGTKAGCEEATPQLLRTNQNMLPGRDCGSCHRAGGQATNSPFTIAGTVFGEFNAACNPGGLNNVFVEILDGEGDLQPNGLLRTNGVGNFYSSFRYVSPMRVRVREYAGNDPMLAQVEKMKGGMTVKVQVPMGAVVKEAVMVSDVGRGATGGNFRVNCAECHQFPGVPVSGLPAPPGRVYLDASHSKM